MKLRALETPKVSLVLFFLVVSVISLTTPWQWSYLMDDIQYLDWMPKISGLFPAFVDEIKNYLGQGRLYPIKYFMNLIQFAYLPSSPGLLHAIHWVVWALALSMGYLAVCRQCGIKKSVAGYLSFVGLGAGVRSLLDSITLLTIAETWVMLFMSLGLYFLDRPLLGRAFLLLTAFSKEPAACIFAGMAVNGMLGNRRRPSLAALDGAIFLALCALFWWAKAQGSYLSEYSLISVETLKAFAYGIAKTLVPLVPLAVFIACLARASAGRELVAWLRSPTVLVLIPFSLGYGLLVAPRGTAGYLWLPVAFALYLIAFHAFEWMRQDRWSKSMPVWAVVVYSAFFGFSVTRWSSYNTSINEGSQVIELLFSSRPRLVLINGLEATTQARSRNPQGSGTRFYSLVERDDPGRSLSDWRSALRDFEGEVIVLELTRYFGEVSKETLDTISQYGGFEWDRVVQLSSLRLIYGDMRRKK